MKNITISLVSGLLFVTSCKTSTQSVVKDRVKSHGEVEYTRSLRPYEYLVSENNQVIMYADAMLEDLFIRAHMLESAISGIRKLQYSLQYLSTEEDKKFVSTAVTELTKELKQEYNTFNQNLALFSSRGSQSQSMKLINDDPFDTHFYDFIDFDETTGKFIFNHKPFNGLAGFCANTAVCMAFADHRLFLFGSEAVGLTEDSIKMIKSIDPEHTKHAGLSSAKVKSAIMDAYGLDDEDIKVVDFSKTFEDNQLQVIREKLEKGAKILGRSQNMGYNADRRMTTRVWGNKHMFVIDDYKDGKYTIRDPNSKAPVIYDELKLRRIMHGYLVIEPEAFDKIKSKFYISDRAKEVQVILRSAEEKTKPTTRKLIRRRAVKLTDSERPSASVFKSLNDAQQASFCQ